MELEDEFSGDEDEVKPPLKIFRPKTYGVIEGGIIISYKDMYSLHMKFAFDLS